MAVDLCENSIDIARQRAESFCLEDQIRFQKYVIPGSIIKIMVYNRWRFWKIIAGYSEAHNRHLI